MHRFSMLGLFLLLSVMLFACAATDPNNLFEVTALDSVVDTSPETSEAIARNGYHQYGNMQKNIPSGEFILRGKDVLFTYISDGNGRLYCYDLTTGEVESYCKDATCKHDNCVASKLLGNLEVYNGKLYTLVRGWMPVELTETEQRILSTAKINGFFHCDDKMYARTADSSLVVFEPGEEEPRVVLDEFTGYWHVVVGRYMYANTGSDIIRVDLTMDEAKEEVLVSNAGGMTDGKHIYYTDSKTSYLYRCDMDGGNVELLLEQPVLLASMNFDDEYFYYRLYTGQQLADGEDAYNIYRFPKSDPREIDLIATLPVPAYQVFTVPGSGKIFVLTYARSNGECSDIYVMGTDGSNPIQLEIPEY